MQRKKERICLLDWDGTLRSGYTILDWVAFLNSESAIDTSYLDQMNRLKDDLLLSKLDYDAAVWKSALIYARAIRGCEIQKIKELAFEFVSQDTSCTSSKLSDSF